MCSTTDTACPLRQSFEDSRNSNALYVEIIAAGVHFSERARAGLFEMGMGQLRQLDTAAKVQLIEGNAPS